MCLFICWRILSSGKPNHSLKKCTIFIILCDSYLLLYSLVDISVGRNRSMFFFLALLNLKVLLNQWVVKLLDISHL